MKTTIMTLLSTLLFSSSVFAVAIEFSPKVTVWECPKGASYLIMQCQAHEVEAAPVRIEMQDIDNGFYLGTWSGQQTFQETAFAEISVIQYPNDKHETRLGMNISIGFNEDKTQNTSLFLEGQASKFSDCFILQAGERHPFGEGEIVTTLEACELKTFPEFQETN